MTWLVTQKDLDNVFPTTSSKVVFIMYMAMFVAQGLLVSGSREGGHGYSYNVTTVVLITEMIKLIISTTVFITQNNVTKLLQSFTSQKKILLMYLIPAALYCVYNNLTFYSLLYLSPTSYFMFMQTRLLLTGLIYQIFFKRKLSMWQWASLAVLTLGCTVHGLSLSDSGSQDAHKSTYITQHSQLPTIGLIFIVMQVLCSVIAGVFNEYIIKGCDADIMIQNIFMYLDSILCNLILLSCKGELAVALNKESLVSVTQIFVILIVINNSFLGIVTSFFLKNLNVIVKAFASALELGFTAVLSAVFLGIPLTLETAMSVLIICVAVIMYAKHPVQQQHQIDKQNIQT